MIFILSKLFWWIARPSLLLVAIPILGVFFSRWRAGRIVAVAGAILLAIVVVLPVGSWLEASLENRFPPPHELPAHVDGIIVLGGTIEPALTHLHGMPALNDSAERIVAFVGLARRYPDAKLVFTGGSASVLPGETPEADIAKPLFADLGLDPARIIFERESRNTYENAIELRTLGRSQARPGLGPDHLGRAYAARRRLLPARRLGGAALAGRLQDRPARLRQSRSRTAGARQCVPRMAGPGGLSPAGPHRRPVSRAVSGNPGPSALLPSLPLIHT